MDAKIITIAILGVGMITLSAIADGTGAKTNATKRITLAQLYDKKLGGRLQKPGTGKGATGFINVGSAMEKSEINRVVATIGRVLPHKQIVSEMASLDGMPTAEMVKNNGIAVGVFVVSDPKLPPMLVAPEERWSLVNVAKLKQGLKDDAAGKALYQARCRGELQRAFCMVSGCGLSQYDNTLMNVCSVNDLDNVNPDMMLFDVMARCRKYLMALGVDYPVLVSYQKACREGWAPAPTNDVQKAIWDKVHQLPTKPIKILPETKPVKE